MKSRSVFDGIIFVALCAALLYTVSPDATAQTEKRFTMRGTTELGGSISFQSISTVTNGNTGDAVNYLTVAPFVGFFLADGFELGFNPFGISYASSGGSSAMQLSIFIAPAYNFTTQGSTYPFIEGLIGYTSTANGSTRSGLSFGGRAGMKQEVAEHALLNIAIQYLQITTNPAGASNRYGSNQLALVLGFSIWV
ncbi:MAG: hypothetical protein M5R41_13950 [Bacteroidia bacterium]|nr:hypothetical protein [Bacteroidia bacterium]